VLRATATKPPPIREPQVRVERPAFGAQLRGREEASDLDATLEVPPGFVLHLTQQLAEGRIQDRAGQLGFRESLRAQILHANTIVLPRQVGRQFVEEVAPLVGYLAVHASHSMLRFLPATAARLLPGEVLLSFFELPVGLASEPGSRDALTIGEDKEIYQSRSTPTGLSGVGGSTFGISNSVVRATYQCPVASRLNVALFVLPSTSRECRMRTQPTFGT
jgi:hypothetical protein